MIVTIDGIPVYQATMDGDDTRMLRISLVDDPAVQSDFLKFSAQPPRRQLYSVADDEKRLVRGVVMRADFPIYRRDDRMGEYYIIYKADTIRTMAEKYLVEGRQNDVNLMHEEGSDVDGVHLFQWFIKDSAAGISPEGFDDIADGSLFAEFHVVNDDVWAAVKDGTYKGFSLEGIFDLVPETDADSVEQIVRDLNGIFNKHFKNLFSMGSFKKFKARLARALMEEQFGTVTTDKGILGWEGDEDLKAGDRVYIVDEEGERVPAPDDTYTTSDGKAIAVVDGAVAEITDPAAEVSEDEFGEVNTDNGRLEWDGEDDLKAGDRVYVRDENDERVPAPDGDYVTEDGKTIRVADGAVAEISDPAAEVAPAPEELRRQRFDRIRAAFEESYSDKVARMEEAIHAAGYTPYGYVAEASDDFAIYCYWDEEGQRGHLVRFSVSWDEDGNAIVSDPVEGHWGFIPNEEPEAAPAQPDPAVEELRSQLAALKAENETLRRKPLAKSAHQEFQDGGSVIEKTGNRRLDNLARIASAK